MNITVKIEIDGTVVAERTVVHTKQSIADGRGAGTNEGATLVRCGQALREANEDIAKVIGGSDPNALALAVKNAIGAMPSPPSGPASSPENRMSPGAP